MRLCASERILHFSNFPLQISTTGFDLLRQNCPVCRPCRYYNTAGQDCQAGENPLLYGAWIDGTAVFGYNEHTEFRRKTAYEVKTWIRSKQAH